MSNKEGRAAICTAEGGRSWGRRRWSMLAQPLLCGLAVVVCLVLLPFQPPADQRALFWIVGAVAVSAVALEMNRSSSLCQRGLIELRSVRLRGGEQPAFLIPFCPHALAAGVLLCLFLCGASFYLLTRPWLHPGAFPDACPVRLLGGFGMSLGLVGTRQFLRWIFVDPPGLAFLPEGLLTSKGAVKWFTAWDWMEEIARVKLRLVGVFSVLGLRLTDVDNLPLTALRRRRLKEARATCGWHYLHPPWFHTLSLPRVVYLANVYRQKPAERAKIGSEEGLAGVKAVLAVVASCETTAPWPARPCP